MNAQQREFLVKHVTGIFNAQKEALQEEIPRQPSLNNHIVAALLAGKLQILPSEEICERLLVRAKNMDKEAELIEMVDPDDIYGYDNNFYRVRRKRRRDEDDQEEIPVLRILAEEIFIMPPG